MNGDIDAYHDPMDMLHDATQYLERVRQTLVEADRFEDILQVRSAGELYRQYAGQRRYGLPSALESSEVRATAARSRRCARPGGRGLGTSLPPLRRRDRSSRKKNR